MVVRFEFGIKCRAGGFRLGKVYGRLVRVGGTNGLSPPKIHKVEMLLVCPLRISDHAGNVTESNSQRSLGVALPFAFAGAPMYRCLVKLEHFKENSIKGKVLASSQWQFY